MTVKKAVEQLDWNWLAGYISARLNCVVAADDLQRACRGIGRFDRSWPDDTWLMWLKNRLHELGAFRTQGSCIPDRPFLTPMHTFFIFLEETAEMMCRLRRNEPQEEPRREARSKITKSNLAAIEPIDRVARRVVVEP